MCQLGILTVGSRVWHALLVARSYPHDKNQAEDDGFEEEDLCDEIFLKSTSPGCHAVFFETEGFVSLIDRSSSLDHAEHPPPPQHTHTYK
jgi:hypothetical protein